MFDTALAWHLSVGRSRAFDLGRSTFETGNLCSLFGISTSRSIDQDTRLAVVIEITGGGCR